MALPLTRVRPSARWSSAVRRVQSRQIQEFIFPFQSIPAQAAFRAYAFFSWLHLVDVLTALAMGVPALAAVLAFALMRRSAVAGSIRRDAPQWIVGRMGVVLVVILYPGVGIIADQYFLVPELAVLQILSLGLVLYQGRRPWLEVLWPLLALTLAATAYDWQAYWQGALRRHKETDTPFVAESCSASSTRACATASPRPRSSSPSPRIASLRFSSSSR